MVFLYYNISWFAFWEKVYRWLISAFHEIFQKVCWYRDDYKYHATHIQ